MLLQEVLTHPISSAPDLHDLGQMRLNVVHHTDRGQFTFTDLKTGEPTACIITAVSSIACDDNKANMHVAQGRGVVGDTELGFAATLQADACDDKIIGGRIQFFNE